MTDQKPHKRPIILQSIVWAAAMIGTSLMLEGSEHRKEVFFLLLILSIASILSFGARGRDPLERTICRLIGRGNKNEA